MQLDAAEGAGGGEGRASRRGGDVGESSAGGSMQQLAAKALCQALCAHRAEGCSGGRGLASAQRAPASPTQLGRDAGLQVARTASTSRLEHPF